MAKFAPLNGAFMATSMLGILISVMYVYPQSIDFGIASTIIFSIMFISSIISMTLSSPEDFIELEEKPKKKKRK
jgi:hypothetical protein